MPAFLRKPAKTCGALVVLLRARAGALAVAPSICATTGDVARVDPFAKFVSQLQLYKILEDSMPSNCLTKALLVSSSGVACEEAPSRSSFMLYSCLRLSTLATHSGNLGCLSQAISGGACAKWPSSVVPWPESQGVLIVHLSHSAHLLQLQLGEAFSRPPVFSDSPGA